MLPVAPRPVYASRSDRAPRRRPVRQDMIFLSAIEHELAAGDTVERQGLV